MKTRFLIISLAALVLSACGPDTSTPLTSEGTDLAPGGKGDVIGADAEELCWNTGGAFEEGECFCEQDGASIGFVFDSEQGCVAPSAGAEELCWNTGGAFEEGECFCAQDGASLDHVFSSSVGCIHPDTLCEDTGGVAEGGECACEQDGASIGYEFLPAQGGCTYPALDVAEAWLGDGLGYPLGDLVDPEVGVYVTTRPGAFGVIAHHTSIAEAIEATPYLEAILGQGYSCTVEYSAAPAFACEFASEGCFASRVDNYEWDRASSMMERINEYLEDDIYSAEEIERARKLEQIGNLVEITITEGYLSLVFERVEGNWYLRMIDTDLYDCSA